jgi:hypothetical protein
LYREIGRASTGPDTRLGYFAGGKGSVSGPPTPAKPPCWDIVEPQRAFLNVADFFTRNEHKNTLDFLVRRHSMKLMMELI